AQDGAGWVINSGMLIGGYTDNWIGGYSIPVRKHVWWRKAPAPMTAPPGSFGSSVMVGYRDGTVQKLEALTGEVQWTATLDSFTERDFLLASSSLLVVTTAAQTVYALDYQTGKTLWLFDGGFP